MVTTEQSSTRRTGKASGRIRRVVKWLVIVGVVGALVSAVSLVVMYQRTDIPSPNEEYLTETTKVMYANGKTELGDFVTQERESISFAEMPDCIKDAVVAAENRSFWTDPGLDPRGIIRAAFNNASGGSTQGASTITQQYVKVLYLTQERSLPRKAKEAMLSLKIQREMSKEEILEGYLNTIYFGRGAYGIQAASEAFFARPAKKLTIRQCAALASVINNPTRFDPANGEDSVGELESRYQYVLSGMSEMEKITAEQYDRASEKLPKFPKIKAEGRYAGQRGHALKLVRDELDRLDLAGVDDATIDGGGLRITTTLQPEAMEAVEESVTEIRPAARSGKNMHVGAASVDTASGELIGFYGGHDYLESQINWAVAGGMAGSTMKAFTNAAAIVDGFSLRDTFNGNSPIDVSGTEFENQGNQSYGSAVSMIEATRNSINTAYIDMVDSMDDGPRKVIDMAKKLGVPGNRGGAYGIPTKSIDFQENLGVTLGTVQVSPINMANAYASIANGGKRSPVHVIKKVTDRNGRVLYQYKSSAKRVLDEDIAADVSYSLQQVVQGGSGTEALALGRPAAGKTGTATNGNGEVSSSWFVGYTPQVATAVMYVRGTGREQLDDGWVPASSDGKLGYFGGNYPAKTWTAIMQRLMEGRDIEAFPEPVYVDGTAPVSGHEPYTPPPSTSSAPAPAPSKSATKKSKPKKTPKVRPSDPETPKNTCPPRGCKQTDPPTPTDLPTDLPTGPTTTPVTPPGADGTDRGGRRPQGRRRTDRTAG